VNYVCPECHATVAFEGALPADCIRCGAAISQGDVQRMAYRYRVESTSRCIPWSAVRHRASESRSAAQMQVVWTKLALIGCPGMECGNVLEGEPLGPDATLRDCGKPGRWLLGRVFLCQEHGREIAEMGGDDIDEIEAAWKAQL
jgi:hypothetical protein